MVQCGLDIIWSVFTVYSQYTPYTSPLCVSSVLSFVGPKSDLCSTSVIAVLYAIALLLTLWPLGDFNKILEKQFSSYIILVTDGYDISSDIALRWTLLDLSGDKSTLVQVMAWCRQATSHYLNQCWPRFLPPYGVTRPQWVNSLAPGGCSSNLRLVIFKLITKIC